MSCKHSIFTYLLVVLLGTACTGSKADYDGVDSPILTFRTVSDLTETRTQLLSNGSIVWSPGDAIGIVYGDRKGTFVSTNRTPAATVEFKGTLGADFALADNKTFLAVYPHKRMSSEVNEDGTVFGVVIPPDQPAVEEGFDHDIFPSAARSKNFDLYFYNLCGGVKFSLAQNGVKKVVLRGNNNERLAGLAVFNFPDGGVPAFSHFSSYTSNVTLSASGDKELKTGVWYYLAALPCRLSKGYTMELHFADNHVEEISNDKPVEIRRATWGILANLGNVDPGPKAELTVSPTTLDFGSVNVGETENRTLSVTNSGEAGTIIRMGFPVPEKPGYQVEPGPVVEIAAGQTKTFTVSLTPRSASDYNGKMEIAYDDELLVVELIGAGQEAPGGGYQVYASRDYEGKSYLIEANVDLSGDYRLNPDGTKFYPAKFRYSFGSEQFELPDTFYIDADCEDKTRFTSCVAMNLSTKDIYIFVFEKDEDSKKYSMTGYMYVVNGGAIKQSSRIFTKENWGWFPYFEYDNTLLLNFFSYDGYYAETAKLNASGSWTISKGSFIQPDSYRQIRAEKEAIYFFEEALQGAELHSNPSSLDFGTVSVGSSSQKSLQITNTGDTGTQAKIEAPSGFNVNPSYGVYINPGESKDFTVTFLPIEAKDYSGYMPVSFDGGVCLVTLNAVGEASSMNYPEPVDLGLSVKWGACNIGATVPEGFGEYYSWGGLEPQDDYDWAHYRYGASATTLKKYCINSNEGVVDNRTVLGPEDDIAAQTLKDKWRMPTESEFNELLENCKWNWTQFNGVSGYKVVSKINGNTIFLPTPGQKADSEFYNPGSVGYYWSSTLSSSSGYARGLCIHSSNREWLNYGRYYGHSIRPVYGDSTIPVEHVSLDKRELEMAVGESSSFIVTIFPENATNKNVSWSSSNESVASVSSNGVVTGISAGSTIITVTTSDGGQTATCNVTVTDNSSSSLSVPEAIDLGLPSGLKWASFNLGASKPEEYGDYYAWGETEPYYRSLNPLSWDNGKEAGYDWTSYKWCLGSYDTLTKYCTNDFYSSDGSFDGKAMLDPEDDAANVNLGGKWRMPTQDELDELWEKCTMKYTTINGVKGEQFIGPNGNSIFLPAAGRKVALYDSCVGTAGYYWSSTINGYGEADYSIFYTGNVYWENDGRCDGQSIRPVYDDN